MRKLGFYYKSSLDPKRERIYFIEGKGKDIGFNRWRVTLYYKPNFAKTEFFKSQEDYDKFIKNHAQFVYDDYMEFRGDWEALCLA